MDDLVLAPPIGDALEDFEAFLHGQVPRPMNALHAPRFPRISA